jgi:hypothetical protein
MPFKYNIKSSSLVTHQIKESCALWSKLFLNQRNVPRNKIGQIRRETREKEGLSRTGLRLFHVMDKDSGVTRKQIENAVASGLPFTLRMADSKEYTVPHRDHISLAPNASYVIVYDDEGGFTVLPLLTMTGL